MLWVYGKYKYFNPYSAEIDFRRQILTYKVDPRTVWVNLCGVTIEISPNCIVLKLNKF